MVRYARYVRKQHLTTRLGRLCIPNANSGKLTLSRPDKIQLNTWIRSGSVWH